MQIKTFEVLGFKRRQGWEKGASFSQNIHIDKWRHSNMGCLKFWRILFLMLQLGVWVNWWELLFMSRILFISPPTFGGITRLLDGWFQWVGTWTNREENVLCNDSTDRYASTEGAYVPYLQLEKCLLGHMCSYVFHRTLYLSSWLNWSSLVCWHSYREFMWCWCIELDCQALDGCSCFFGPFCVIILCIIGSQYLGRGY